MKTDLFFVGGSSKLAQSLAKYFCEERLHNLDREIYSNWIAEDNQARIFDFFKERLTENSIIFITAAILDANATKAQILGLNYQLPLNIISALKTFNVRVVTFGTILEKLGSSDNNYVDSKIKLSTKLETISAGKLTKTHFRIHTLYGNGKPNKFMFLGQIFSALKNKTEFHMTSGEQIREYHHYDDVANAIHYLTSIKKQDGICEITYGNGLKLKDIAIQIFDNFDSTHLLKIGTKKLGNKEKFENDYIKNPVLNSTSFREPVVGINEYLKSVLNKNNK